MEIYCSEVEFWAMDLSSVGAQLITEAIKVDAIV